MSNLDYRKSQSKITLMPLGSAGLHVSFSHTSEDSQLRGYDFQSTQPAISNAVSKMSLDEDEPLS